MNDNSYGFFRGMFDLFMVIVTGGLWLIYLIVRYLRTH